MMGGRKVRRSCRALLLMAALCACQAQPPEAVPTARGDYESGQVYLLEQPVFLVVANDQFADKDVRTWLCLVRPGAEFGNLSDADAMEKYLGRPSAYPEIKGILGAGTRLEFKFLAPAPNMAPLPFISPANSTDVWLAVQTGAFTGSVVEASAISDEPASGVWARVDPAYLAAEQHASRFPER